MVFWQQVVAKLAIKSQLPTVEDIEANLSDDNK